MSTKITSTFTANVSELKVYSFLRAIANNEWQIPIGFVGNICDDDLGALYGKEEVIDAQWGDQTVKEKVVHIAELERFDVSFYGAGVSGRKVAPGLFEVEVTWDVWSQRDGVQRSPHVCSMLGLKTPCAPAAINAALEILEAQEEEARQERLRIEALLPQPDDFVEVEA